MSLLLALAAFASSAAPVHTSTLREPVIGSGRMSDDPPSRDARPVSVVTTLRTTVQGIPVYATDQGLLVWTSEEPFSAAHLDGHVTAIRAVDMLAVAYDAPVSVLGSALLGTGIGFVALAIPIAVTESASDDGSLKNAAVAGVIGGAVGGVLGGILASGATSTTVLDIGGSHDRYEAVLADLRAQCLYDRSAPVSVVRLMPR